MKTDAGFLFELDYKPTTYSVCGAFYWRSKRIALRGNSWATFEEIVDTLIHEINHWASSLGLTEKETQNICITVLNQSVQRKPYPERITERQADWFEQQSMILFRG